MRDNLIRIATFGLQVDLSLTFLTPDAVVQVCKVDDGVDEFAVHKSDAGRGQEGSGCSSHDSGDMRDDKSVQEKPKHDGAHRTRRR